MGGDGCWTEVDEGMKGRYIHSLYVLTVKIICLKSDLDWTKERTLNIPIITGKGGTLVDTTEDSVVDKTK